MIDRLINIQKTGRDLVNRGRSAASDIYNNAELRREIFAVYAYYFGRTLSGCKNCYLDALVELVNIKKEKVMEKSNNFVMRRGKLLRDTVNFDPAKLMVRGNETDELALYHIYTNKRALEYFEVIPNETKLKKMLAEFEKNFKKEKNETLTPVEKIVKEAKEKASKKVVKEAKEKASKKVVKKDAPEDAPEEAPEEVPEEPVLD